MESLLTVCIATFMPETKVKVCKVLWTNEKHRHWFMQVMETPFRNCKKFNLEVDKVSFINVKHNFHKGLSHQKKHFFSDKAIRKC